MKDFLGSFAEGAGSLAQAFLLPAVAAIALWDFFILDVAKNEPGSIYADLRAIDGTHELLVLAGASLVLALAMGVVTPTTTRVLEGYWWGRDRSDGWAAAVWNRRVAHHHAVRKETILAINELVQVESPTRSEKAKLSSRYERLRRYPPFPKKTMPTRLGNILRAAETFGPQRYELDPILMWDALIAGVPDSARAMYVSRRTQLDLLVSAAVLPLVFVLASLHATATTPVSWRRVVVATLIALLVSLAAYLAAVEAAKSYADAVIAILQLGRVPLAESLGLRFPTSLAEEREMWRSITGFTMFGAGGGDASQRWMAVLDASRSGSDQPIEESLSQLADLHAQGALTDDEFASAKARLLAGR